MGSRRFNGTALQRIYGQRPQGMVLHTSLTPTAAVWSVSSYCACCCLLLPCYGAVFAAAGHAHKDSHSRELPRSSATQLPPPPATTIDRRARPVCSSRPHLRLRSPGMVVQLWIPANSKENHSFNEDVLIKGESNILVLQVYTLMTSS